MFETGVTASLNASMLAPDLVIRILVEGDAGAIEVNNALAPQTGHALRTTTAAGSQVETVEGPTTYEAQLTALRTALVHGQAFPFPADDYVRSMDALDRVRTAFADLSTRTSSRT